MEKNFNILALTISYIVIPTIQNQLSQFKTVDMNVTINQFKVNIPQLPALFFLKKNQILIS